MRKKKYLKAIGGQGSISLWFLFISFIVFITLFHVKKLQPCNIVVHSCHASITRLCQGYFPQIDRLRKNMNGLID
jgi:hypothetical protein